MRNLKEFKTELPIITGEYCKKTTYLSWEYEGDGEQWSQGEHYVGLINGEEHIIVELDNYVVVAKL
jgi:hypothetical protein